MNQPILRVIVLLCLLISAGISTTIAIPAAPQPITVTQSDGTKLTIRIMGDEYNHQILSQDGYTLIGGPNNDYYYATLASNGELTASSVMARPMNQLTAADRVKIAALPKGVRSMAAPTLRRSAYQPSTKRIMMSSVSGMIVPERISNTTTTGKLRSLIILVQFSDINFTVSAPQQAFTQLLTQDGYSVNGATGSAWNYYFENSNGLFDPEFVVVGPYTVSRTASYYAGRDGTENPHKMVSEACKLANDDVDFSQYADDGLIRDIFIFYAGYNQAEGVPNTIWPHRGDVRDWQVNESFDGARLAGYACSSEYNGTQNKTITAIGTFCHEFGHVLGWPDFYDTDYEGSGGYTPAIEDYSLMCMGSYNNNSRTPPALNILERWMVGWATPQLFTHSGAFQIDPITENVGYILPLRGSTNEYFLAEVRGMNKNVWDNPEYIKGSGMLIYHVDYSSAYAKHWRANSNTVNATPKHECMKLLRSSPMAQFKPGLTFFPGSTKATQINTDKYTAYNGWSGLTPIISMDNIAINGTKVHVDVTRSGGPEIFFKAETYQTDALLSWTDESTIGWTVTWAVGSEVFGTKIVEKPTLYLSNLRPATTYKVTIEGASNEENWKQNHSITTLSTGSKPPRLGISKSEYAINERILLTLVDYRGSYKELQWLIDGQPTTETYVSLPQGEHRIQAIIIGNGGAKEYITKYITVK